MTNARGDYDDDDDQDRDRDRELEASARRQALIVVAVLVMAFVLTIPFLAIPARTDGPPVRVRTTAEPAYAIVEVEYRGRVHSFLAAGHGLSHFASRDADAGDPSVPPVIRTKGVGDGPRH